jgi:hypothetical protein
MKEKVLMTSFYLANLADYGITKAGLAFAPHTTQELMPGIGNWIVSEPERALVMKLAMTTLLIGADALAKQTNSRLEFTLEKSLQLANVILWAAVAWNTALVAGPLLANLS